MLQIKSHRLRSAGFGHILRTMLHERPCIVEGNTKTKLLVSSNLEKAIRVDTWIRTKDPHHVKVIL